MNHFFPLSFPVRPIVYLNIGYNSTTPIMLSMITSNLVAGVTNSRNWKIRVSQIPCNEGYAGTVDVKHFQRVIRLIQTCDGLIVSHSASGLFAIFHRKRRRDEIVQFLLRHQRIEHRTATFIPGLHDLHTSRNCMKWICFSNFLPQVFLTCFSTFFFVQGFCQMQYNVCPDPVNSPGLGFSLTGALLAGGTAVASGTDAACATDYLMIPCASSVVGQTINVDGSVCATRLCGSAFNAMNAQTVSSPVYSKSGLTCSSRCRG